MTSCHMSSPAFRPVRLSPRCAGKLEPSGWVRFFWQRRVQHLFLLRGDAPRMATSALASRQWLPLLEFPDHLAWVFVAHVVLARNLCNLALAGLWWQHLGSHHLSGDDGLRARRRECTPFFCCRHRRPSWCAALRRSLASTERSVIDDCASGGAALWWLVDLEARHRDARDARRSRPFASEPSVHVTPSLRNHPVPYSASGATPGPSGLKLRCTSHAYIPRELAGAQWLGLWARLDLSSGMEEY